MKSTNKFVLLIARAILTCLNALLLFSALSVAVSGQTIPPASNEPLRGLDFLLGEWKGKGWMSYGPQSRKFEISQNRKVKIDSSGTALLVKDSISFSDANLMDTPWHIKESTLSYDDEAKLYRWRVKRGRGNGNPFEARLAGPRKLHLIIHTPDGMARTTIEVTEDETWHETFESLSSNGWVKLQETVLKKAKTSP